jgi:drug/metabolite transporter (DMT)-like permease
MNGILLMLCADFAFALMAAATKSVGARLPASEVVFIRSAVSLAALLWMLRARRIPLRGNGPRLLWARGIVGYIALQCYFWALPQIPLGTAVMLNYTAPIFAVALSFLWLKENPPLVVKWLLGACFGGIYLLAAPRFGGPLPALLAGLLSGVLAGSVYVMIRRAQRDDSTLLVVFYFALSSTVGSGALLSLSGWTPPTPSEWWGLALITASSFIGQLCLTRSLQKSPVWLVSPFGYLTPVLGLFLGILFWEEYPDLHSLAGGGIVIVCGVLMLVFSKPRDGEAGLTSR